MLNGKNQCGLWQITCQLKSDDYYCENPFYNAINDKTSDNNQTLDKTDWMILFLKLEWFITIYVSRAFCSYA